MTAEWAREPHSYYAFYRVASLPYSSIFAAQFLKQQQAAAPATKK